MSAPVDNKPWNAEEDEYCVWLFFCAPLGMLPVPKDVPGNRTPQQLLDRFFTVIKHPMFRERVRQKCHGDIFQVRGNVPFSPIEDYLIANSQRLLQTSLTSIILRSFAQNFHLSRTKSTIDDEKYLLYSKGKSGYDIQLDLFKKFKESIIKKYSEEELMPLDLNAETVSKFFVEKSKETNSFLPEVGECVDEIDKNAQEAFVKGELAAFRGKTGLLTIKKPITYIGRNSQFVDVDIDLTPYHNLNVSRKHAVVKLCTDLKFYIECLGSNIIVNGKVLLNGEKALLGHRDIVDIGGCLFIFIERLEFMNKIRKVHD